MPRNWPEILKRKRGFILNIVKIIVKVSFLLNIKD